MDLDTQQLSDLLGVTTHRVNQWVREGAPVKEKGFRGRSHVFDSKEFLKWRDRIVADNAERLTLEEARLKKLSAEAAIQELELAKRQGAVVDLEEIEQDLINKMTLLRTGMRAIPERVVLQLIGLKDEVKIKQIILKEIDDVLKRALEDE